nr:hypothetical protein BaRGS_019975 [Batillaria attramentaria]
MAKKKPRVREKGERKLKRKIKQEKGAEAGEEREMGLSLQAASANLDVHSDLLVHRDDDGVPDFPLPDWRSECESGRNHLLVLNAWLPMQQNWVECVVSALKFLSGDVLGLSVENFVPFLDYKERAQQWKWIGAGRDSNQQLAVLFRHWLKHKNAEPVDGLGINTVVSGALDRLHSEKDPCVKYDVNSKLWIYLHRSRTEEEFERIHQAQGAAAKAKKSLQRPKASKAARAKSKNTAAAKAAAAAAKAAAAATAGLTAASQAKMVAAGQAGLVPAQFIVQQAPGVSTSQAGAQGTPIIVSQAGGKGGQQNIQVVRTVLSQQGGLKPGQATILISQPALQQAAAAGGGVLSSAQVIQAAGGATGSKTTGRGSPKGKAQPVYARIITPPPGMKLTTVGPNQVSASGNVNVLQTVGKLLAGLPTSVAASAGNSGGSSGGAIQQTVTTFSFLLKSVVCQIG